MSIFRGGHDEFGQALTNGLSWDLLPVVFWAAVVIIVAHLVISAITGRRGRGEG